MPIGLKCAKCSAGMSEGFIPEALFSRHRYQVWVEGPMEVGILGVKTAERIVRRVRTYRCIRCGYLEAYANDPAR